MNELQIFNSEEFGDIRTVTIDNESWFVGKDVATALGYKDTSDALKKHVADEDKLTRCFTDSGQSRQMYIINESGLYALIFGSKLDSAKRFKHWVTSEVLPAIRKTGSYQRAIDLTQLSPELQMFNRIFQSVAEQQLEQKRQAEKIAEVENRVDSIREVVSLDTTSWRDDTGKILKKIGLSLGGGSMYSQVRSESYELLEKRFGVNLKQRLINKRRRMAEEGESKSKRDKLSNVDIIAGDKKLIEGYTAIVKEMAIHYGVA